MQEDSGYIGKLYHSRENGDELDVRQVELI